MEIIKKSIWLIIVSYVPITSCMEQVLSQEYVKHKSDLKIDAEKKSKSKLNSLLDPYLPKELQTIVGDYLNYNDYSFKCTTNFEGHDQSITSLCQLQSGRLVSGSFDKKIKIWDLNTNDCVSTLGGCSFTSDDIEYVGALFPLPNDKLASTCCNGTIKTWDLTTNTYTKNEGYRTPSLLFQLEDGKLAGLSHGGGVMQPKKFIWDVATKKIINTLEVVNNSNTVFCQLQNGSLALTDHSGISAWDLTKNKCTNILQVQADVRAMCQLKDGRLALGLGDGTIQIWDLTTNIVMATLEVDRSTYYHNVTALYQLEDGRLVSGHGDGTIRIWSNQYHELISPAKADSKCTIL